MPEMSVTKSQETCMVELLKEFCEGVLQKIYKGTFVSIFNPRNLSIVKNYVEI